MFRRIHWNNRGHKSIIWRCISKLEPTGLECHARIINELDQQEIVLTALYELLGDKSKYQKQLQQTLEQSSELLQPSPRMVLMRSLWSFNRSLLKTPTTKKPTMRLQTRFLHSKKSASRPQWTRYSVVNNYNASQNCRISSKTHLPTLQYLMNPL